MIAAVRRLPLARPTGTDAALLARFAADRDEAAFAELGRRHGGWSAAPPAGWPGARTRPATWSRRCSCS